MLLATIGSWRDTWTDEQVLDELQRWNKHAAADALEKVREVTALSSRRQRAKPQQVPAVAADRDAEADQGEAARRGA